MSEFPFEEIFVPGRVCLFGEHSDWSGAFRRFNRQLEKGYTIVCGTNQGLFARVRRHPSKLILRSVGPDGKESSATFDMESGQLLAEAQSGSYWSYMAGVAYKVFTDYHVCGLEIDNYRTTLPIGKGLSSSAAIAVMTVRAFNRLYDLKLTVRGEMEYAYQGEILTPSQCGRMDQSGCAFGEIPVLMEYDGEYTGVENIRIGCALHLVIVDLKGTKSTTEILKHLQGAFPHSKDNLQKNVQSTLGQLNKEIVMKASKAMQLSDPVEAGETLGELMTQAQRNIDQYLVPACPPIDAPLLRKVLEHPEIEPLIYGGKSVGAGGNGTAQLLCKGAGAQDQVMEIVAKQLNMDPLTLTLTPSSAINTAIIPAGGFSSALFPASKVIKSELFPILDKDGICKPLILQTVEQLYDAGLTRIIIIVQPVDLRQFQTLFHDPVMPHRLNQLTPSQRVYANRIAELGRCVEFVEQPQQLGLGHAVLCAKQLVNGKPFLLALGHHRYVEHDSSSSCISQVLNAYSQVGSSVVGLNVTPMSECSSYGTVSGVPLQGGVGHRFDDCGLYTITQVVEKPSVEYAQQHMMISNMSPKQALTIFGLYALDYTAMEYLAFNYANGIKGDNGDLEFSPVLERLRKKDGLTGIVVKGARMPLRTPHNLVAAIQGSMN